MADIHFTSGRPDAKRSSQPQTSSSSPTVNFWDSLSKIWLTKLALKELDRRNRSTEPRRHCPCPSPVGRRPLTRRRRPLTRHLLDELRRDIQSENTPASDFLRACGPAALSDIQAFARHGGPDLLDLRGYPFTFMYRSRETMISSLTTAQERGRKRRASESESSSYIPYTSTKRSRSTGAYDPNFRQRMINDRIYPDCYRHPDGRAIPEPQNWNELQRMLIAPRSLSSDLKEMYEELKWADAEVKSEQDVMDNILPIIQGTKVPRASYTGNIPFICMADMMRGESHKAKPDRFYGARPEQLHLDVRDKLQALVIPALQSRPIAPNFFVEVKPPSGLASVALNQACFAGAVGARGMHSLQTYSTQTPTYDNNAYTLSATYHSGQLKIYSHYVSQPNGPGTQPKYYMHQLGAYAMTHNRDMLVDGLTAFRNAESWTAAQRNAAINHANAIADGSDTAATDPIVPHLRPRPRPRLPRN